jgi:hypothetical protein
MRNNAIILSGDFFSFPIPVSAFLPIADSEV